MDNECLICGEIIPEGRHICPRCEAIGSKELVIDKRREIKIVIPDVPPSLNEWSKMHWAKVDKLKKQWEHDVYYCAYSQRPKKPIKYAKVKIIYYFKTNRARDLVDNYAPKFIMDGIVKAKILVDDRTDYIGVPELVPELDKDNPRTEIYITEVAQ